MWLARYHTECLCSLGFQACFHSADTKNYYAQESGSCFTFSMSGFQKLKLSLEAVDYMVQSAPGASLWEALVLKWVTVR